MALDLLPETECGAAPERMRRGQVAYHGGLAAEDAVARHYHARGYAVAARRWRGLSGEIDLVLEGPDDVIFVEVKQARTHAIAAERLGRAQVLRIHGASDEYADRVLGRPFIDRQFHLALVDGAGRISIIEDAFLVM